MSFYAELKRRSVFRVAIAYAVVAWLLMQVGDVLAPALHLPGWVQTMLAFFLILGFPMAIFFAWAFELTPDGLKHEREVDPERPGARTTGRKLDYLIISALVLVAAYFIWESRFAHRAEKGSDPISQSTAANSAEVASGKLDPTPLPAGGRKSIAVLPFENLSSEADNAYFAAGVHEDILTHLSRIAELKVNSRTSVQQYADSDLSLKEIATALGAAYIVEGSVRRAGNRVRVTAQLIDAGTDAHLWADNFDRDLTDIFAIQTMVAQEIVAALQAELSPREADMLTHKPTDSIEAYDLLLRARQEMQSTGEGTVFSTQAHALLEQALQLDPGYAQAWALLAISHGSAYWFGSERTAERLQAMKAALDRAFELQPDLPEAVLALATYYYRGFYDYPRALEQLERARTLIPNDAILHVFLGLTLRRLGEFDRSADSFAEAVRLDPAASEAWAEYLETTTQSNRTERAVRALEEVPADFRNLPRIAAQEVLLYLQQFGDIERAQAALARSAPSENYWYLWASWQIAWWTRDYRAAAVLALHPQHAASLTPAGGHGDAALALLKGGFETEARQLLAEGENLARQEAARPGAGNYIWPHLALAKVLVLLGKREEALAQCAQAVQILPLDKDHVHGAEAAIQCAWVKAEAGDTEAALDDLALLMDHGWNLTPWILTLDPQWDLLRGNPRFDALATPQ